MNTIKHIIPLMLITSFVFIVTACGSRHVNENIPSENSAQESISSMDSTDESGASNITSDIASTSNSSIEKSDKLTNDKENSNQDYSADHSDVVSSNEDEEYEPVEMNSLQTLFSSITSTTTREEIDEYIEENNLVYHAFTGNSAYYIGYEKSAIRTRGRDREGEAIDISFVTSGDLNLLGTVYHAEYANHTGFSTHYSLEFKDNAFYYTNMNSEIIKCKSGYDAMQRYLTDDNKNATPAK